MGMPGHFFGSTGLSTLRARVSAFIWVDQSLRAGMCVQRIHNMSSQEKIDTVWWNDEIAYFTVLWKTRELVLSTGPYQIDSHPGTSNTTNSIATCMWITKNYNYKLQKSRAVIKIDTQNID